MLEGCRAALRCFFFFSSSFLQEFLDKSTLMVGCRLTIAILEASHGQSRAGVICIDVLVASRRVGRGVVGKGR